MASVLEIYTLDNPLFKTFVFYACVLSLKMLAMSPLTGRMRFKKGAFANPEDLKGKLAKVRVDDDVERVRRAHMNDIENIFVFLFISNMYLMTNPSVWLATMLIRTFTAARIMHTLVYAVFVVPQPARGLSWAIGYGITIFMAVSVLKSFVGGM